MHLAIKPCACSHRYSGDLVASSVPAAHSGNNIEKLIAADTAADSGRNVGAEKIIQLPAPTSVLPVSAVMSLSFTSIVGFIRRLGGGVGVESDVTAREAEFAQLVL